MSLVEMKITVNGKAFNLKIEPSAMLADVLRDELSLKGTKIGCRQGECGVCAVLLDGEPVNSCILPALKAQGRSITTIEGLAGSDGKLDPIQEAFMDEGAVQCGFCTPGMIINAKALLSKIPRPTERQIREALSGVLCRCTGYHKIVEAVLAASRAADLSASSL
jgi:carbon-monoxide dehydrogenase small subunit